MFNNKNQLISLKNYNIIYNMNIIDYNKNLVV